MAKNEATLILKIKRVGANALSKTKDALGGIARIAGVAGAAIVGFIGASVDAFRTQELAINELNQSLVSQGVFTKDLSKKYQDMASSLQKVSTFGDEAIISSQAQLQAYLGQTEVTEELMQATLDFAAAQKVDLKTAAGLVGKSIGSATNGLARYGIELDTSATKSEKLAAVTKAMKDKFEGQAAAQVKGLGVVVQMKNSFGDFMELVGERFAPLFIEIANGIKNFIEDGSNMDGLLTVLSTSFAFISKTVSFVISNIKVLGVVIGTGLAASMEAVSELMKGNFTNAKNIAKDGIEQVSTIIEDEKKAHNDRVILIDEKLKERAITQMQDEQDLVRQNEIRKAEIKEEARQDAAVVAEEARIEELEKELAHIGISDEQKLALKNKALDEDIKAETNAKKKLELLKQKSDALELERETKKDALLQQQRAGHLSTIAGLENSNNKTLAGIGKAASSIQKAQAIRDIAIATPVAVAKAFAAFPPPANFVAAAGVGIAMAAQAANIAGVQLAEGGIVQSRPGGIQATIGEGGQDEAVIPLDDAGGAAGIGTTININVNGGMLGNESEAREFAQALDGELFKLRQNNESTSFDDGII